MIDYESLLNHEIKAVKPSGIRKFFDIANEMEDVISLSIGEPDFSTPCMFVKKRLILCSKAKHGILQIAVFLNCARKFVNGLRENIM